MDFTREPIIETVITPRDGCKIVVRSSKNISQEEYFVDAVEIVSFGGASFFRSQERPKAFMVPVSDYEVLEVREARIVLKNVGLERSIKIAGGRETQAKPAREDKQRDEKRDDKRDDKHDSDSPKEISESKSQDKNQEPKAQENRGTEARPEGRGRRDRRRGRGRRRGEGDEGQSGDNNAAQGSESTSGHEDKIDLDPPKNTDREAVAEGERISNAFLSELLTPPPMLISQTLDRYRENALFQGAFYTKEELAQVEPIPPIEQPEFDVFEVLVPGEQQIWDGNGALISEEFKETVQVDDSQDSQVEEEAPQHHEVPAQVESAQEEHIPQNEPDTHEKSDV